MLLQQAENVLCH